MDKALEGIIHGRTIELANDPGFVEGMKVQVVISPQQTEKKWGEGICKSAGGWYEYPEMDEIMNKIHEDRKQERRNQEGE
jgi:hypothetical protein